MGDDRRAPFGSAAGAVGVVLFLSAALVMGERPDFDSGGAEMAALFDENRTRIQVHCAMVAVSAPFFVWFLATVASLVRDAGGAARRTAAVAYGCGLVFVTLLMVDVTTLAVGALRPDNMVAEPELAATLVDLEFMTIGMATPAVCGTLAALAVLVLRDGALWPRWVGLLAAVAASVYALRIGTLFTTEGPFAADSLLGIWLPVAAFAGWLFAASVVLALRAR